MDESRNISSGKNLGDVDSVDVDSAELFSQKVSNLDSHSATTAAYGFSEEPHRGDLDELVSFTDGEASQVVTARGTERGLVLRIDGRADWADIMQEVDLFLRPSRKFFAGGQICLEWLTRMPMKEQCSELERKLKDEYSLEIAKSTAATKKRAQAGTETKAEMFESSSRDAAPDANGCDERGGASAEEGQSRRAGARLETERSDEKVVSFEKASQPETSGDYVGRVAQMLGDSALLEEEANARIVYGTLRSGQRIETPYNLLVIGEVNPGADLVAGGDIIVLGSLRGTAHAGAYDDDIQDRVVIALHMQPMQLRIGSIISRGSDDLVGKAEIARIDERRIVVEEYTPRLARKRKII